MNVLHVFFDNMIGTFNWVSNLITFNVPWNQNYFYGLILVSLIVFGLELVFPWRKNQASFRKDFWQDCLYMFFNFFVFSIAISGFYAVIEYWAKSMGIEMTTIALFDKNELPYWGFIVLFFVVSDFVQWITHVLLHRTPFLWNFHKVHHSVTEMGFAAHLRYHWMENILYKPLKTFAVMILVGAEPENAFFIHFFSITIGHLNHANLNISWGPLRYIFNNPVMHLYHHAKNLPSKHRYGVNYGISLSLWDYLFGTNYIPEEQNAQEILGFDGIEEFPKGFLKQLTYGFFNK